MIAQFEIWWVSLDPTVGVETRKTRPCLVISSNIINKGQMVFVAPFLKGHVARLYAVNVIADNTNNLDMDRRVDLRQMRSIDKKRLQKKQGFLDSRYHVSVLKALDVLFKSG